MKKVLVLGFLVFSVSYMVISTPIYAINLDDDEEDAEDVADLLDEAKKAGESESFNEANELLKKAKLYDTSNNDVTKTEQLIVKKEKERDDRIEKARLAKLEKERKEKERLARIERENSYVSSSSSDYSSPSSEVKTYDCTYQCRTSGFILYDHAEFTMMVQANEVYQAQSKVEDYADTKCNTMKGATTGLRMWDSSIRCEQRY